MGHGLPGLERKAPTVTQASYPVRHGKRVSEGSGEVISWEYLIVALPRFQAPTSSPQTSVAVQAMNEEGARGWEAVSMVRLDDESVAVLFKRPLGRRHLEAPSDASP